VDTSFAGVFYLAGRVLEIELAERLWAAGAPEGSVLAHTAAAITGTIADPAWAWFGGAFYQAPVAPDLPAWAAAEVVDTVQHALGRRLVRYGISLSPAELDAQLEKLASEMSLPFDLAPTLRRVVCRSAAALCLIVGARLQREASLDALLAICTRPGRLLLAPNALHVIMNVASVDIEHRRAGLDHDPGHVPWLGRSVQIEFVGAESE
jgi:hypothetical protein